MDRQVGETAMYPINLLSALAVLMITLFCEVGFANPPAMIPAPDLNEQECNARRLLRFRQVWNMYWIRNDFLNKPQSDQKALTQIMARSREPIINGKTFDETTQILLEEGKELRKRLRSEIAKGSRDAGAARQNLNYLNDKLTKRVADCRAFSGDKRQWAREFEHVGTNSVGITSVPLPAHKNVSEVPAPLPPAAVVQKVEEPIRVQAVLAPIPVIVRPDLAEAAGAR